MYALLTALIVFPNNAIVDVYLDSQATIHSFNKYVLSNHLSLRKLEKVPNYTIWIIIRYITDHLNLQVSLHKIKAHAGNYYNEIADRLAKDGCNTPPLSLLLNNVPSSDLSFCFNNIPIEVSIRGFLKQLFAAQAFGNFLNLNRNDKLRVLTVNKSINWFAIWNLFSMNTSSLSTSFASCKLKSFIIKNFIDELPSLSRLTLLRPDLYEHWPCVGCNVATETAFHIWTCPSYSSKIMDTISATKNDLIDQLSSSYRARYTAYQTELEDVFNNTFASPSSAFNGYTDIIQSRIPSSLINTVHKIAGNKERCLSIISRSLLLFHQKLYDDVWKYRCNLIIAKERSMGITKQDKRKRSASSPLPHRQTSSPFFNWKIWIHLANKFGYAFSDF